MRDPGYILVVCTGNICRSPMGAALLQHALAAQPEPLRSLRVYSGGIASRPGEPASANAVAAMRKVGVDLRGHASRMINQRMLENALLVLCMTESHRALIADTAQLPADRVHLFRGFMDPPGSREISDPYGMNLAAYEAARDDMVAAIPSILDHLSRLPHLSPGAR